MPATLDAGTPFLAVNAAAATGASAIQFSSQRRESGGARTLNVQAVGAGAVPTTVTANLEASSDGGSTFQPYGSQGTGLTLVATSVGTQQQVGDLIPGIIYRINITSLTIGSATSVSVWVTES